MQTFLRLVKKKLKHGQYKSGGMRKKLQELSLDFEKGFIRSEVIFYQDYLNYKSEAKIKEAGKLRVEGKDYMVKDGDIMHFRFNV